MVNKEIVSSGKMTFKLVLDYILCSVASVLIFLILGILIMVVGKNTGLNVETFGKYFYVLISGESNAEVIYEPSFLIFSIIFSILIYLVAVFLFVKIGGWNKVTIRKNDYENVIKNITIIFGIWIGYEVFNRIKSIYVIYQASKLLSILGSHDMNWGTLIFASVFGIIIELTFFMVLRNKFVKPVLKEEAVADNDLINNGQC